jgi:hypothetical protein
MKYDKYMDKDCIELCDTLNSLNGIRTFESCCGHLKNKYLIFMYVNNFYSLSILARAFDRRYSNGKWKLEIITNDTENEPFLTFSVLLYRTEIFISQQEMEEELKQVIDNINYWGDKRFEKHLKGVKEKKENEIH